jgi:hypothetical protein
VLELLRDPRYGIAAAALVAVIAVAAVAGVLSPSGADTSASPTPSATATRTATDDSRPEDVDFRRRLELAKVAEVLERYFDARGAYPSTAGVLQHVCSSPADAGCALVRDVDPTLPVGDGTTPYWYVSDGRTYTLLVGVETAASAGGCYGAPPEVLGAGGAFCIGGGPR